MKMWIRTFTDKGPTSCYWFRDDSSMIHFQEKFGKGFSYPDVAVVTVDSVDAPLF